MIRPFAKEDGASRIIMFFKILKIKIFLKIHYLYKPIFNKKEIICFLIRYSVNYIWRSK